MSDLKGEAEAFRFSSDSGGPTEGRLRHTLKNTATRRAHKKRNIK